MGSYINIGLIAEIKHFKQRALCLLGYLEEFTYNEVCFPADITYSRWFARNHEQCKIENAVDYCMQFKMAEIKCDFVLGGYGLKNALFQVEDYSDREKCVLIEMPEDNDIFDDINVAEYIIIDFFNKISGINFKYGFCDNEASADDRNGYSIFVDYTQNTDIILQSWKIDGLTRRV